MWLSELRASEAGLHLELSALAGLNLASWALVVYDSRAGSCGSCLPTEVFLITRTTVVPDEGASGLGTLHLVTSASFGETVDAVALLVSPTHRYGTAKSFGRASKLSVSATGRGVRRRGRADLVGRGTISRQ